MVLVAVCMVAIIAMAALSIDVVTLYLARQEAQRAADAGALAAARVISVSGITGTDPGTDNTAWESICGGSTSVANLAATSAARVNAIGGIAPTVSILYSVQGASGGNTDCYNLHSDAALPINPTITVQVTRSGLPTLFSRIWTSSANSVSATAVAEVFNSSNSGTIAPGGEVLAVQPRCVKPWVVPNLDPRNPDGCTTNCTKFVDRTTGQIQHPGVSLGGVGSTGTIGENFWLEPNCQYTNPSSCNPMRASPTQANLPKSGILQRRDPPNLLYLPSRVGTAVTAIPACSEGDAYEEAIEGCDAPTNYQCGVANANTVDLSRNPDYGATSNGVSCLIHQSNVNDTLNSSGQDYLSPFGAPTAYPFQILAGSSNPAGAGLSGNPISSSSSIVSLPIYDNNGVTIAPGGTTSVTFVGFLQVFINAVDQYGSVNVTVLNVSGCGNNASSTVTVPGSSPVPIRLITPQ